MDPFVQAARRFTTRSAMFWKLAKRPILRAVTQASSSTGLAGVLRWEEAQPHHLRPLVLVEAPFTGGRYFESVTQRILDAYFLLREAAEQAGTPLPDVSATISSEPVVAAVKTAEDVAAALPATLDGIAVALLPSSIAPLIEWPSQIATLVRAVIALQTPARRVRWVVHDGPTGALRSTLGTGVELPLDETALFEWWKTAQTRDTSKTTTLSATTSSTRPDARELRSTIALAVDALRQGQPERAIPPLRRALEDCARSSNPVERDAAWGAATSYAAPRAFFVRRAEKVPSSVGSAQLESALDLDGDAASLAMLLGASELLAGAPRDAAATYRSASTMGVAIGAKVLAVQAKLGEAGATMLLDDHRTAAQLYEEAAALAEDPSLSTLRIEAWRMAGVCSLLAIDAQTAVRSWRSAVNAGLDLPATTRAKSSFAQAANDLVGLLRRLGMQVQAVGVERQIASAEGLSIDPEAPPITGNGALADVLAITHASSESASLRTQRVPVALPRSVLPFVRGPVDPGALDAMIAVADRRASPGIPRLEEPPENATKELSNLDLLAPALPFTAPPADVTRPLVVPPFRERLPFEEAPPDPALFGDREPGEKI